MLLTMTDQHANGKLNILMCGFETYLYLEHEAFRNVGPEPKTQPSHNIPQHSTQQMFVLHKYTIRDKTFLSF